MALSDLGHPDVAVAPRVFSFDNVSLLDVEFRQGNRLREQDQFPSLSKVVEELCHSSRVRSVQNDVETAVQSHAFADTVYSQYAAGRESFSARRLFDRARRIA